MCPQDPCAQGDVNEHLLAIKRAIFGETCEEGVVSLDWIMGLCVCECKSCDGCVNE